jgi:hypothetical protein
MGIIKSPLGTIKGKLGNIRFSTWKGKNTVASQPSSYNDKKTETQVFNRNKFTYLQTMQSPLLNIIRVGFAKMAIGQTAVNEFVGRNLKKFLVVNTLTKTQVLEMEVSEGPLEVVQNLYAELNVNNGTMEFNWDDNSNGITAFSSDQIYVGAFDTVKGVGFSASAAALRDEEIVTLQTPQLKTSNPANIIAFAFFRKIGTDIVSNSSTIQVV